LDIDLIGTASYAGQIAWFENDGDENFTMHIIFDATGRPSCAYAVDLDSNVDLLATVCGFNQIMWFENDGDSTFSQHVIASSFYRPHAVLTADFDNDSDVDILASAINSSEIAWWENDGAQSFTKHTISNTFNGATGIFAKDVDQDGDIDVLGTAQFGDKISWWESDLVGIEEHQTPVMKGSHLGPTIISGPLCFVGPGDLSVYNICGKIVRPETIGPGVYFIKSESGDFRKIIKIR
jgi:hypothetical protein